MQSEEEDLFGPVVVSVRVDELGDRVSVVRRVDGSTFEIRVPRGAMRAWDDYAAITPGTMFPWQTDFAGSEIGQDSDPAARRAS